MSDDSDDSVGRLEQTRDYIRCLLEHRVPDAVLTHAWDEFYKVYHPTIHRIAVRCGLGGADLEDCQQEVWLSVQTNLREYEYRGEGSGLRAWFSKVVRSKVADMVRYKMRRPAESLDQTLDAGAELTGAQSDPARAFDTQWERSLLETIIANLMDELAQERPPTNRLILQRRLIEHRPVAEVATELRLTPEAVRSRTHRLVEKLRVRFALFAGDPLDNGRDSIL